MRDGVVLPYNMALGSSMGAAESSATASITTSVKLDRTGRHFLHNTQARLRTDPRRRSQGSGRTGEEGGGGRTSGAVAEGLGDALGRPAQPLAALVLAEPRQQRADRRLHGVGRRRGLGLPAKQLEVIVLLLARARGGHGGGEVCLLERSHGGGIHCPRRLLLGGGREI